MKRPIAMIGAALLAAAAWSGTAGASPVALNPRLIALNSPIPDLVMAAGLGSDVSINAALNLADPLAPVIRNAAGENFRFRFRILGSGLAIVDPQLIPNGFSFPFRFGGEMFTLTATIAPTDDLTIDGGGEGVNPVSMEFTMSYFYGVDPASSVTFSLCCDDAGGPFSFAATAVPEPAGIALLGTGLLALGLWRRRAVPRLT